MASLFDKFLNKLNFIDGINKTIKFTCFKCKDKKFKSYWEKNWILALVFPMFKKFN